LLILAVFASIVYSFILANTFWRKMLGGLTYIVCKKLDKRLLQVYLCTVVFS